MKIQKLVVVILLSSLLIIMVAGCSSDVMINQETESTAVQNTITEFKYGLPQGANDYYFATSSEVSFTLQAYSGDKLLTYRDGLEDMIRLVSSDPTKIALSINENIYNLDDRIYVDGKVAEGASGIYSLYVESADGSVKSAPYKVIVGQPLEAMKSMSIDYYVPILLASDDDDVLPIFGKKDAEEKKAHFVVDIKSFNDKKFTTLDDPSDIIWVTSDPSVISVETVLENSKICGYIQFHKTGTVDIHAETKDGRLRSNSINLRYGNELKKDALAVLFVDSYVISRVRFKTGPTTSKPISIDIYEDEFIDDKEHGSIRYSEKTETTYTNMFEITHEGDEIIVIKGMVNTFTEYVTPIRFGFTLRMRAIPDTDYEQYEVLEETYERPEYIKELAP